MDREVEVVRENLATESQEGNGPEGKTYRYGGWWVEDAKYAICAPTRLAQPIVGPWIKTFRDPIAVSPEMGQLQLVYEIDPAARILCGTVAIMFLIYLASRQIEKWQLGESY